LAAIVLNVKVSCAIALTTIYQHDLEDYFESLTSQGFQNHFFFSTSTTMEHLAFLRLILP